jgi:hypothetical protein
MAASGVHEIHGMHGMRGMHGIGMHWAGSPAEIFHWNLPPRKVVGEERRKKKEGRRENGLDEDGQRGMWSVSGTDA